jgi:hypothetical protein
MRWKLYVLNSLVCQDDRGVVRTNGTFRQHSPAGELARSLQLILRMVMTVCVSVVDVDCSIDSIVSQDLC